MSKKFPEYSQLDLPAVNREMLKEWDEKGVFKQSLEIREGNTPYVFYEAALGQRHAGDSPRDSACHQGYFLPLQDDEGVPGASEGRLGYTRASRGAGGGKDAGHHQGGYRQKGLRG